MRKITIISIVFLYAATVLATGFTMFSGPARQIKASDLGIHLMDTSFYTENWAFLSTHEDGSAGFCNFLISRAGLGKIKPGAGATFWSKNGKVTSFEQPFEAKQLMASNTGCDISLGPHAAKGGFGNINIHFQNEKISADLRFTSKSGPFAFNSGKILLGNPIDAWEWIITMPRAKVEGSFITEGRMNSVKGYGYVDHTWSNLAFFSFSTYWVSARIHGPEYSVSFIRFKGTKKMGGQYVTALLACSDSGIVASSTNVTFRPTSWGKDAKTGYTYPQGFDASGNGIKISTHPRELRESIDVLATLPSIERVLVQTFVTNPRVYRIAADVNVEINTANVSTSFTAFAPVEVLYMVKE